MSITANLVSDKPNVLNSFLDKYFEKDMLVDEDTFEWSYTFHAPYDAVNLVSALMDSEYSNIIDIWISFDPNVFIKIRTDNYNEIIKYIINRFQEASWKCKKNIIH